MNVYLLYPYYCENITWIVVAHDEDEAIRLCIERAKERDDYREDWEADNPEGYYCDRIVSKTPCVWHEATEESYDSWRND